LHHLVVLMQSGHHGGLEVEAIAQGSLAAHHALGV
jgi:hypothetical protein